MNSFIMMKAILRYMVLWPIAIIVFLMVVGAISLNVWENTYKVQPKMSCWVDTITGDTVFVFEAWRENNFPEVISGNELSKETSTAPYGRAGTVYRFEGGESFWITKWQLDNMTGMEIANRLFGTDFERRKIDLIHHLQNIKK